MTFIVKRDDDRVQRHRFTVVILDTRQKEDNTCTPCQVVKTATSTDNGWVMGLLILDTWVKIDK